VEDDDLNRDLIRRALQGAGYEVREARNGREALRQFELCPANLVIIDLFMPEMGGLETIWLLIHEFFDVTIIAMSEHRDELDFLAVARLFGARRTLRKPIRIDELLRAVQEELQQIT